MTRAAPAALLLLALAGCATHPPPPVTTAAPAPVAIAPAFSTRDPRTMFIANAQSMLGQPYHWGGAAPGGFDCSGLVAYAAAGAGIRVPRTAKEQRAFGTRIDRDELQPGDLVFMHLQRKELHVGIALDGQRFIHAPSSGGFVRIDKLAAAPYRTALVDARRIIAAP